MSECSVTAALCNYCLLARQLLLHLLFPERTEEHCKTMSDMRMSTILATNLGHELPINNALKKKKKKNLNNSGLIQELFEEFN